MGFWKDLFRKVKKKEAPEEEQEIVEQYLIGAEDVNLADSYERKRYIESLLEQMADATKQIDACNGEYQTVNSYLKDIEELEYIDSVDKQEIQKHAQAILHLATDKKQYEEKKNRMSDEDFKRMQLLEDDADEGVRRMKEAEEYQSLIRGDLRRLEGEKQACIFRRSEAENAMNNLRGMTQIILISLISCVVILLIMQLGFGMNTKVGFILAGAIGAIALLAVYMYYLDAVKEKTRSSRSLNKVILLQNRVKIRYVNNTNLLEYFYMKFGIASAAELEKLREKYAEEKSEREKFEDDCKEMTYSQEQLVKILNSYHFYDPLIWLHQAKALLDPKEMVEVRHALILRRQKIRQRLDFNTKNATAAREQIKEIVASYPEYAKEILRMVSEYETGEHSTL
ncbi:MAG: hypothetical protein K5739_02785 [Lachnospiraceae bacterium]|nr:hypothetical protein [Lachnospiraceae bacterium]